jgi:hypothetical protein
MCDATKALWACPVCWETDVFPMVGACGHGVCEECARGLTDCSR